MTRDEMFAYALSLPETEDSTLFGGRCIRLNGKGIVNTCREPGALSLSLDRETIALLVETEPRTYFLTDHFTGGTAVMVRPEVADDARLRQQIDKAWTRRATRAQRAARDLTCTRPPAL